MRRYFLIAVLILALIPFSRTPVSAHQPFCEEEDLTPGTAWHVPDPSISVAFYGTLAPAHDIDYFNFDAQAGQQVLLSLTIPQIEGQQDFAPLLLVWWHSPLPDRMGLTLRWFNLHVLLLAPPPGEPPTFFEPFTGTSYWQRQEQHVTLPASGRYEVSIWHPGERVGRYVFVIGQKEVIGGDLSCLTSLPDYWTPVDASAAAESHDHTH